MGQFEKALYYIWMLAGVVGFPASVGWLLYRWQKVRQASQEHVRTQMKEKLGKTGIFVGVFLLILVGFIVYSMFVFGDGATPKT